jgi:hypothetical protein
VAENMEAPVKLAASVVSHFKRGASAVLEACTEIANAFAALEEEAWSQAEFLVFFEQLGEAGIGPGSSVFLKTDSKGITTFDPSLKAGVYFQMRAVGRCAGFKNTDFVAANRTTSYSTLYRLSVLYNVISEKSSGNALKKRERAEKAILELVSLHGVSLTRKDVEDALINVQKERRSRAPVEKTPEQPVEPTEARQAVKLPELLAAEDRYDLLFLTPSDEFLAEAESSSLGTLMDRAPYQELRKSKSSAYLVGRGNRLAGLQKLAEVTGELSYRYLVREKPDDSSVIDLSNELVVFGSSPWSAKSNRQKGESAEAYVRRVLAESSDSSERKLHLFADEPTDGWDCCSSDSSTVA